MQATGPFGDQMADHVAHERWERRRMQTSDWQHRQEISKAVRHFRLMQSGFREGSRDMKLFRALCKSIIYLRYIDKNSKHTRAILVDFARQLQELKKEIVYILEHDGAGL
jgi:hypothetical protein